MKYLYALVVFLIPVAALAANTTFVGQIVPQCPDTICRACDLVSLADNILRFMVELAVFVAALMFAYAGFLYVTAAASKSNLETAKKIFWNVFLGLIFILTAWLIIDLSLRVLTTKDLNVMTQIQCVDFVGASDANPTGYVPNGNAPTVNNPVNAGGAGNQGLTNVDSITNYTPQKCNSPSDQTNGTAAQRFEGCQWDSGGKPIQTVQDYKDCQANPGGTTGVGVPCSQVTSVTVAVPQGSGISHSSKFTWPELARYYGLPDNTVFSATDSYGRGRGYTTRGTYSVDVATCGGWNTGCNLPSRSNSQPFSTAPTPIPGG